MSSSAPALALEPREQAAAPDPACPPPRFATLDGERLYRLHVRSLAGSFVAHILAMALVGVVAARLAGLRITPRPPAVEIIRLADTSEYALPASLSKSGGGGGGGDRDKLPASRGALPRFAMQQLAPPAVIVRNENPRLPVEPTVVVPPDIRLNMPQTGQLGDPLSAVLAPLSGGPGSGGGIGSGRGGGVGSGSGPGVGPGHGGGVGGGAFRVGGGVSAPRILFAPDPEFSDEARKAKYQGTVLIWLVVDRDGHTRDIRIQRSLGMGLDEKAIEAIRHWRFEPGRKDGVPVAVQVSVEVNFRLY